MEALTRATFKSKEVDTIPDKAKILSKDVSLSVEEIENGFLISKNTEIKYQFDGRTDYSYNTKKWFSVDNPLEIDEKKLKTPRLTDLLGD